LTWDFRTGFFDLYAIMVNVHYGARQAFFNQ
jgi:hypothetical protein